MSFKLPSDLVLRQGTVSLPMTTNMPTTNERPQKLSSRPTTYREVMWEIRLARKYHLLELSRLPAPSERDPKDKDWVELHERRVRELEEEEAKQLQAKAAYFRRKTEQLQAEAAMQHERRKLNFQSRKLEEETELAEAEAARDQDQLAHVCSPRKVQEVIEEERQRFLRCERRQLTREQEAKGRKKVKKMLEPLNKQRKEHGECETRIEGTDKEGRVKVRRTYGTGMVRDLRWSPAVRGPVAATGTVAQEDGVEGERGAGLVRSEVGDLFRDS